MQHQVSHRSFEVRQYPEHAITPTILYLHVGEEIPAAAAQTAAGGWEVILFGTTTDVVFVVDEDAARGCLERLGQKAAA